jgi:hypothetical protein
MIVLIYNFVQILQLLLFEDIHHKVIFYKPTHIILNSINMLILHHRANQLCHTLKNMHIDL